MIVLSSPALADPVTDPAVTQETLSTTVCVPGYTKHVRAPSAWLRRLKLRMLEAIGEPPEAAHRYQLDHAMPLALSSAAYERRYGPIADIVLASHGLIIDRHSRHRLLIQIASAVHAASWQLKRNATGDYGPDPVAVRFPLMPPVPQTNGYDTIGPAQIDVYGPKRAADSVPTTDAGPTWDALIACWQARHAAGNRAAKTRRDWEAVVKRFAAFVNKAPSQVTRSDVRAWRDKRLADGAAPRTIKDNDLTCFKAVFVVGIEEDLFSDAFVNPADGIKVALPTGAGQGEVVQRGYTDEEAAVVVRAALASQDATLKWMTLLLVTTGARGGKIALLRACDIREIDGHVCLDINTAMGRLKNRASIRVVPIHPVVIGLGLLDYVASVAPTDRLFVVGYARPRPGSTIEARPAVTVIRKVSRWIGSIPGLQVGRKTHGLDPCHGFRHAFKTRGRSAGVSSETLDAICGHAPATVGASYGVVPVAVKAAAVALMPVPGLEPVVAAT